MKIILLKEDERIQEGLRSLTEEFNEEHPYYSTWIQENKETFEDGSRVVYELTDNGNVVGYMMIHFSTTSCAKVNGIYVFPNCQRRGYAKEALSKALEELGRQNYKYVYIQTRMHNKIMVHVFDILNFYVVGQNFHSIEEKNNMVAVYDLKGKKDFEEMTGLAEQLYPGFSKI